MILRAPLSSTLSTLVLAFAVCGCGGGGGGSSGSGGGAPSVYYPSSKSSSKNDDSSSQTTTNNTSTIDEPGTPAPKAYLLTAEGVMLYHPVWIDMHPDKKAEMLAEIRNVTPEADARIDAAVRGVPAGEWRGAQTIYVAWRGSFSGALLPALNHELRHMLTQDPNAGH